MLNETQIKREINRVWTDLNKNINWEKSFQLVTELKTYFFILGKKELFTREEINKPNTITPEMYKKLLKESEELKKKIPELKLNND